MGTTALRQLLKSLCSNSKWQYAVFWKLKQASQMILMWEDGYCDYPRPREAVQSTTGAISYDDLKELSSLQSETGLHGGSLRKYSIGLVVAELSSLQHTWGEGFVGKVASTSNPCWVFSDDYISNGSELISEHPYEWLPQFVAGIKSILLVPVLPHGVLQLGSLERVAENMADVAYIRDIFSSFHSINSHCSSYNPKRDISAHASRISRPTFTSNLDESAAMINAQHSFCQFEGKEDVNGIASNQKDEDVMNQDIPPAMSLDALKEITKDLPAILEGAFDRNTGIHLITGACPFDGSQIAMQTEINGTYFESPIVEEEPQVVSEPDNNYTGCIGEASDRSSGSYFPEDIGKQPSGGWNVDNVGHIGIAQNSTFPVDCERYSALGPSVQLWANNFTHGSTKDPIEDACCETKCDGDINNMEQLSWKAGQWLEEGYDGGYLLEAVVANASAVQTRSLHNRSDNFKTCMSSGTGPFASPESLSQFEGSTLTGDNPVPQMHVTPGLVTKKEKALPDSSTVTFNSMISTLLSKQQQIKENRDMQAQHRANGKEKTRAGESRRPRPRDRQMMQDRLNELRQLIPNGSKFTIDGLLEQTVKHMLFLRSVTDQAEKLKHWANQKVSSHQETRSFGLKDNSKNGRCWALEQGSENPLCPIVVEDLDIPGYLIIEMLCGEHGLFLEIAQVIHQSGLTILKGVMDNYADNMWAQFIVQASKEFHRMDIFWPLMRLLQHKSANVST